MLKCACEFSIKSTQLTKCLAHHSVRLVVLTVGNPSGDHQILHIYDLLGNKSTLSGRCPYSFSLKGYESQFVVL